MNPRHHEDQLEFASAALRYSWDLLSPIDVRRTTPRAPTFEGPATLSGRPWYALDAEFRRLPTLERLRWLLEGEAAPAPLDGDRGERLLALGEAGVRVPAGWTDRPPSWAERELAACLPDAARLLWWPQVCVTNPAWPGGVPWRADFLAILPAEDPRKTHAGGPLARPLAEFRDDRLPRRSKWRLAAIEVDGPHHRSTEEKDAARDAAFHAQGIEVYRVSGQWCVIDPWATIAALLDCMALPGLLRVRRATPMPCVADYSCDVCRKPVARWELDWIAGDGPSPIAHRLCADDADWRSSAGEDW